MSSVSNRVFSAHKDLPWHILVLMTKLVNLNLVNVAGLRRGAVVSLLVETREAPANIRTTGF